MKNNLIVLAIFGIGCLAGAASNRKQTCTTGRSVSSMP